MSRGYKIYLLLLCLAGLLFFSMACEESLSAESIPQGKLYFPVGIAVHPQGFAFVVNSNFDLRYESGSLQVIDLNRLAARIDAGAGLTSTHEDLIISKQSIGLPNFGGEVTLAASSERGLAVVAARQSNQVILVDVAIDPTAPEGESPLELNCWAGASRPSDGYPMCDGSRNIIQLEEDDPFNVMLVENGTSEEMEWQQREWFTMTSYLRSGIIDTIHIPPGRPDSEDVPRVIYSTDTGGLGLNDMAISGETGMIFATSRFNDGLSNPLYYYDPAFGEDADVNSIDLYSMVLGGETRGVDFAADGLTLATVVRDPDILAFLDTTPGENGLPGEKLLGEVVMGYEPDKVRFLDDLVFVTAAQDDSLYVIDSKSMRMIDYRENICRGLFDIDFFDRGDLVWAVVSCFEDDVVAIVDADRYSPGFLDVLARVGEPRIKIR